MSLKNCRNRERGIALIAVLWVLLLLSGLAAAAAFTARTNAVLTHNLGDLAQAQASTDAAIINAIAMLSDEKTSRHPRIDGQPQSWEFRGTPISITISNEAGRIDLNTADDDLIVAFLTSQNISAGRAITMLADLRAYERTGGGPASAGTLRTVDELSRIPNWAEQTLDCWNDALTVYSGLPSVSSSEASGAVTAALKWASDHRLGNRDWSSVSVVAAPNVDRSLLGEVIRIGASTSPHPGINLSSQWIGRLTGDARHPTLTMKWNRIVSADSACKK